MTDLLNNIKTELVAIGLVVAAIGIVGLGIIAIVKSLKGGSGLREVFSGMGGLAVGIILIGAGTAIVGAISDVAGAL